jgi:hypothetical protein
MSYESTGRAVATPFGIARYSYHTPQTKLMPPEESHRCTASWNGFNILGSSGVLSIKTPLHPMSSIYAENTHPTDGCNGDCVIILTSSPAWHRDLIDSSTGKHISRYKWGMNTGRNLNVVVKLEFCNSGPVCDCGCGRVIVTGMSAASSHGRIHSRDSRRPNFRSLHNRLKPMNCGYGVRCRRG